MFSIKRNKFSIITKTAKVCVFEKNGLCFKTAYHPNYEKTILQ